MDDFKNGSRQSAGECGESGEAVEFEFGRRSPELVFELVSEPVGESSNNATEPSPALDVFTAAQREESFSYESTADKIFTTYVPRFTEASENYRMRNDPRPMQRRLESVAVEDGSPELDPTAEIDRDVDGAVVVEMSKASDADATDTLNVYKFSDGPDEPVEKRERTVEDERAEINSLFEKDESVAEEEVNEMGEAEEDTEKREYTLPDPDESDIGVFDFSEAKEEKTDTPRGADREPLAKALGEFTMPIQRDAFKDKFLDTLMSIKIRLGAAVLFSLVLLVLEALYYFGAFGATLFSLPITPLTPAVLDYLAAAVTFALALPELLRSFRYLAWGRILPELMLLAEFVALTLYFAALLADGTVPSYAMYGFAFSVIPVATIVASYYRTKSDFSSFKKVSQNAEKQILDKKLTRELPEENLALDGIVDEYKSQSARFFRASFITDFFKQSAKTAERSLRSLILLLVSLGVALVSGAVALILMDSAVSAASVFTFVLIVASPVFAVISYKLVYHDSQEAILAEDSVAVGEIAFDSFSGVDVIAFDDTEIFGPDDVNLKRFMLYGDRDNMEKAMRQMCSLFSVVGGPLSVIFANALDNRVRHTPAGNPEIEMDGLSGDVGGSRISAGSEAYMLRHGVKIPDGATAPEMGIDTTKIMYAAENGEVYAKFYIRYSFSEEFTMLLPALREEGIVPLVYTRDPNVSNELFKTLTAGADCMRVMKKLTPKLEEEKLYSRVSADIVTYGEKINGISALLISKKYKRLTERLGVSEIYAMGAGAVLAILLSLIGINGIPMLVFGVWHIGWCAVLRFVTKRTLLKEKTQSIESSEAEK